MPDAVDAVHPTNIQWWWDGLPAHRITVLNDPAGQIFDVEGGNVNPDADARSMLQRTMAGKWSVGYCNKDWLGAFTNALAALELRWLDALLWPTPGPYLWAAAPGTTPGTIPAWCPVRPIMVQDRWLDTIDLSTVYGPYPGRVGGYIDGPVSQWPQPAWQRFTLIPDLPAPPFPFPMPGPQPPGDDEMATYVAVATGEMPQGQTPIIAKGDVYLVTEGRKYGLYLGDDQTVLEKRFGPAVPLSSWLLQKMPGD